MPLEFADEVPNYEEGRNIRQAFDLGWAMACRWAERRDLIDDIGSPAYVKARNELLNQHIPIASDWLNDEQIAEVRKEVGPVSLTIKSRITDI